MRLSSLDASRGGASLAIATRRFQPGTVYKDGKLYLFTSQSVVVVRPWPDPRAWRLGVSGGWKAVRPKALDLSAAEKLEAGGASSWSLRCQARTFARIPEPRRLAATRFGQNAWALHNLFSRVPGALELASNCPALAAGLAFGHHCLQPTVTRPLRTARALLRDPGPRTARRVAERLGFEPSRAVVRVLRKLDPADCDPSGINTVRESLKRPSLRKFLLHTPQLHDSTLMLLRLAVGPTRLRVGSQLLHDVGSMRGRDAWEILETLVTLEGWWLELWPDRVLPRIESCGQALRLLEEARLERDAPPRLREFVAEKGGFPDPPLMGGLIDDLRILPLRTLDDLLLEGQAMRHCLGSRAFVESCVGRWGYGYRVEPHRSESETSPQRATLWVGPGEHDGWVLRQLRAEGNSPPSAPVLATVRRWIACQQRPGQVFPPPDREDRGRTLRVVRHRPGRRAAAPPRRRPPPPLGEQLSLDFNMPF
jgi:hypothetical protein